MATFTLPAVGILAYMDDEARAQFATYGRLRNIPTGQVLIREGEANTQLSVVVSGSFHISTVAMGHEIYLDAAMPGDCLGEVAVFQPGLASATVTASTESELWSIEVENLQQFLTDWPHAGCAAILGVNTILSRRLRKANSVIRSNQIVPSFLSIRSKKRPFEVAAGS